MKTVLVIREFDKFSRILEENGFEIINCPMIQTLPLEDLTEFEKKISAIENYDGVFLTSANAAQIFRAKFVEKEIDFHGKVCVLGKRGFDLLKDENLDLIFDETANTAREMLEKISPLDLKDKNFLFVRGEKSLRIVPEFLEKVAAVDEVIVYRTEKIAVEIDKIKAIREKFKKSEIACACFFSPSAAESFLEQFGTEVFHQTSIATIGQTTADFLERQNLSVDFVARKAAAEIFAEDLINYLRESN